MALVVDTSVLYASLDTGDPDHERCADLLEGLNRPPIVPSPVLVELDQLLGRRNASAEWFRFCGATLAGAYQLFDATPPMVARASQIQRRYSDMPIGYVDAFVFVTCEALGETTVATLDHRHFSVLRTKGRKPLKIVPA
jgi:predicted nucleic acid-binding protein